MWRFSIDRGGTFTDVVGRSPDGRLDSCKLLSDDDAPVAGIRQLLGIAPGAVIPPGAVESVRMGTTVATNALLERRGAPVLLLVDEGMADLLVIGDQARPDLFDLSAARPPPLYARVAEVSGRVDVAGAAVSPFDEHAARAVLAEGRAAGMQACAIALMHGWRHPAGELRLAALAHAAGFAQVSMSHAVSPLLRLVPRAETTVADAYLSAVVARHVAALADALPGVRLWFMQSHGGLAEAAAFRGCNAVLSGPAGGIVGAARTAQATGFERVIGFDMGGTSTDVAVFDGAFEHTNDGVVAGVRLRVPMLAIHTIAAGGGSVVRLRDGRLLVGPESAGARPGPRCYRQGGPCTVTDANLCVGRIAATYFPAVFGPGGHAPVDAAAAMAGFAELGAQMGGRDARDVAEGALRVAVASMAGAIRQVTTARGRDPREFALQCFGGAGGQLACLVADELQIATVLLHPLAGVLSAYGMGLADQTSRFEQAIECLLEAASMATIETAARGLEARGRAAVNATADDTASLPEARCFVALRAAGADAAIEVGLADAQAMRAEFEAGHFARFGFGVGNRGLTVDFVAVEVTRRSPPASESVHQGATSSVPVDQVRLWIGGRAIGAPVYLRAALPVGVTISGPALLAEATSTTVIDPGWAGEVIATGMLLLRRVVPLAAVIATDDARPDPVLLALFHALFMGAARQAGAALQRTAQSVNIRERLDFSCAIFDAAGALIANAPHVPVHLGAMGQSVRHVLARRGDDLRPGDALALNDPYAGGTHLPDITVVSPVFDAGILRCFVASRAHHADIGGATPGSTPPFSRSLAEEGVVIDDFLLVRDGVLREAPLRALLAGGNFPARNPDMNIADIAAQVAANAAAIGEMSRIAGRHGWPRCSAYMGHVLDEGEAAVLRLMGGLVDGEFAYTMDDGAPLRVAVRVNRAAGTLTVDFAGTGAQHPGNFNAPPAVTRAVVLYVLRCVVGADIPLNDGCLRPVRLLIPEGSFLAPRPGAAVVAGNTEVSQAVCNALLAALGAAASSQATMNNLLFGDGALQYYETICGGGGAGPGFAGADAVQTHMTNTRMTDPEVLELRAPVLVERFACRTGSGGAGQWHGGEGAVRRLRFLQAMTVTLVSSRRERAPFGLAGGRDGAVGEQWIERAGGKREALGCCAATTVAAGDVLHMHTPGGGGYGDPDPVT
jgi:5-oxoprolinase (ATP-hydrolysing)